MAQRTIEISNIERNIFYEIIEELRLLLTDSFNLQISSATIERGVSYTLESNDLSQEQLDSYFTTATTNVHNRLSQIYNLIVTELDRCQSR